MALQCLQQVDSDLDPAIMAILGDIIARDTVAADTYMTWKQEDYCRAWIEKTLKDSQYVEGAVPGK